MEADRMTPLIPHVKDGTKLTSDWSWLDQAESCWAMTDEELKKQGVNTGQGPAPKKTQKQLHEERQEALRRKAEAAK